MTAPRDASDADAEERSWLRRVASGDDAAFESLIERYSLRLRRLVSRVLGWPGADEVDDVMQDMFSRIWTHAGTYRGDAGPGTWMTIIALNICRSRQRRAWIRRALLSRHGVEDVAASPPADSEAEQKDTCERVRAAVRRLRTADREVIALHYLQEYASAEVARILDISVGAVDVRLHRARQRLRQILGADNGRKLL